MTISVATGSRVEFASALATVKNMTAITNATEAVATLEASHGVVVGDYIIIASSGWGLLAGRVVRAKTVSVNDVTLEGVDTTDTSKYPTGQGTGTVQEVTTWTEITQIAGVTTSGGDQNYADSSTMLDVDDKKIPTSRAPTDFTFSVHDDPALAWYATLRGVADALLPKPLRLTKPSGAKYLANGYWSFQENPNLSRTETTKVQVHFTASARPINYAT